MIQVTRKDAKQSGTIAVVKQGQFFQKDISKTERRRKAIIRQERKALKLKKIKLGQR
jgi:hypothetical protein